MKSLLTITLISLLWNFVSAEDVFLQKDLSHIISKVSSQTDDANHDNGSDYALWLKYLNSPHPSVATVKTYFAQASLEFGVPVELLEVIGFVENNWTQIGPSIDRGWGIMHLVSNGNCHTLDEAANLLQIDPQILKDNAKQNIRGAAALLARYAGENRKSFLSYEDWFEALKRFSGLANDELRSEQAYRYLKTLHDGVVSQTNWDESFVIASKPEIQLAEFQPKSDNKSPDYAPAIWNSSTQSDNYGSRNGTDIDTWVNHWIGVGTYAGAISWFQDPTNTNSSAHFVIRASDGQISQCVLVANRAWHCGNSNSRSIGVEHEATSANPSLWNSVPMLTASATIARYFCNQESIPMTRALPGIRGHNELPSTSTDCPGNLPWTTWMDLLLNQGQVVLNQPADQSFELPANPSLSWNAFSGAASYTLIVSANSDFSNPIFNQSVTTTSKQLSGLSNDTRFYWKVKPNNSSNWSVVRCFKTVSCTKLWTRNAVDNNLPGWFSSTGNTERGIAYANEHVFVVSRNNSLSIKVLDCQTGADLNTLSTSGISGGTYALNDIESSWDGQILACNLSTVSTDNFKIYKWSSESATPSLYINYVNSSGYRLGDHFSVFGDLSATAVIYAAVASSNKVLRWSVVGGVLNSTPTEITLAGITSVGTAPSVASFGISTTADFIVNGNSITPTCFSSTGVNKGSIPAGFIDSYSTSIKSFADTERWLFAFESSTSKTKVINITGAFADVGFDQVYGNTPSLGSNTNGNFVGDIAIKRTTNPNKLIVFVLATNNGLGAYLPTAFNDGSSEILNLPKSSLILSNYPNPFNPTTTINYQLAMDKAVKLTVYNAKGELVKVLVDGLQSAGNHSVRFDGSNLNSGVYFYKLEADGKNLIGKMMLLK